MPRRAASLCPARPPAAPAEAKTAKKKRSTGLTARSAVVLKASNGGILYSKNPHLRLPPASTAKVMTVLVALERLPENRLVRVGRHAVNVEPSKASLGLGVGYTVRDLAVACLVASSNDAAVALAEAVAGTEDKFAELMNRKAHTLGMKNTRFVNATGLPDRARKRSHYTTAYDLSLLMRRAMRDRRIDGAMGLTRASITGSDGRTLFLRAHNKMLWRTPNFVKGKTGWTFASRHTFVGTDYATRKRITFAMLSSTDPWDDIRRLATIGHSLEAKKG